MSNNKCTVEKGIATGQVDSPQEAKPLTGVHVQRSTAPQGCTAETRNVKSSRYIYITNIYNIYISCYYCGPTPSKSPFASIMKRPAWHIPCFYEKNTGGILVQSLLGTIPLSQYFAWLGTGHNQVYGSWHRVKIAHLTQCQECCWTYIRQHIRCKVMRGLAKVVVFPKVIIWKYHLNWAAVYKTNMTYLFKWSKLCK